MAKILETDRLILRHFELADLDEALEYLSSAEVLRFIPEEPFTRERLLEALQELSRQEKEGEIPDKIAVVLKSENHLIGHLIFDLYSRKYNTRELGYIFNPLYHGRGFASEASRALLTYGFEVLNLHRMIATCDPRNHASYNVMEKLGMRREAHFIQDLFLHGEWADEYFYAILQEEWLSQKVSR